MTYLCSKCIFFVPNLTLMYIQGDADYLRYRGMQEFDQAMQHLEEKYGVCIPCTEFLALIEFKYFFPISAGITIDNRDFDGLE